MRRRAVLLVTAALLSAALTVVGCGTDRRGDRVTVLGDSITALGGEELDARLGDRYAVTVDGVFGATVADRTFAAQQAAATKPDQVVVNLGTNDVLHGSSMEESAHQLDAMVGLFSGSDCVHVVTVNTNLGDGAPGLRERAETLNRAIEALPDTHPNVDVVHWNEIQSDAAGGDNPKALTQDGVHPTAEGQRRLADAYGDALDNCGNPWPHL